MVKTVVPKIMVTFLGVGDYVKCQYCLESRNYQSGVVTYVQTATRKLLDKDYRCIVFCTRDAEQKHWENLVAEFHSQIPPLPAPECVRICDGKNTEELWDIFKAIRDAVPENSELVFDVTHSLRSLPIIMTELLNYLSTVKHCHLAGWYYGAFEMLNPPRDVNAPRRETLVEKLYKNPEDRKAPVFDLTNFFRVNEWTRAIHDFLAHSSAEQLHRLAREDIREGLSRKDSEAIGSRRAVKDLYDFSRNVRLANLSGILDNTGYRETVERLKTVGGRFPTLEPILDDILEVVRRFEGGDEIEKGLQAAGWAAEHDLIPQAYTMLRETMLQHVKHKLDPELDQLDLGKRKRCDIVANWMSTFALRKECWKDNWDESDNGVPTKIAQSWAKLFISDLADVYNVVKERRNQLDHAGMNVNADGNRNSIKITSHQFTPEGCVQLIGKVRMALTKDRQLKESREEN